MERGELIENGFKPKPLRIQAYMLKWHMINSGKQFMVLQDSTNNFNNVYKLLQKEEETFKDFQDAIHS